MMLHVCIALWTCSVLLLAKEYLRVERVLVSVTRITSTPQVIPDELGKDALDQICVAVSSPAAALV